MKVVPAFFAFSVAFTEVWPAGIVTAAVLKYALVSRTASFTITGAPVGLGLLSRIGIDCAVPRPMPIVCDAKEMIAGPDELTVTVDVFDVILPLAAVPAVLPFATPVTSPLAAFTVAVVGAAEVNVKLPPEM